MSMIHLEPLCAEYGMRLIDEDDQTSMNDKENTLTKALGVLAENGIYAMSVFLLSCHKPEYGKKVLGTLVQLWSDPRMGLITAGNRQPRDMLVTIRSEITTNLASLILAKKMTEQSLTFARYHAKALKEQS